MSRRVDLIAVAAIMATAGLTPTAPYPGSGKPWPCECRTCGKQVTPTYSNVQRGQSGCKYCAGQAVDVVDALRIMTAAGMTPLTPFPGANKAWPSQCGTCQARVAPSYSNVLKGQGGCSVCAGRAVVPEHAVACMQAAGLEPLVPYPGHGTPWRCTCTRCGREVLPRYSGVRSGGGGCKFCARVAIEVTVAVHQMEAAGLSPLDPYPGSNTRWRCRCQTCHREVFQRHNGVTTKRRACPYCSGRILAPELLASVLANAEITPLEEYHGDSGKPWRCRCNVCGKDISPRWDDLKTGSRCRFCAANAPVDPAAAVAVMRAAGFTPLTPYPGRNSDPWPSRCDGCQRELTPSYAAAKSGRRCAHCAGNIVDTALAVALMQRAGLEPLEPFPGSSVPWRNQCRACGAECRPRYANVRNRGGGCSACAAHGFDFVSPARVYLLTDARRGAHKVGVTGMGTSRLATHRVAGWAVVEMWQVDTGRSAYDVEQAVIRWWRHELGLPAFLADVDGYTETIDADIVTVLAVQDRIRQLLAEANGQRPRA